MIDSLFWLGGLKDVAKGGEGVQKKRVATKKERGLTDQLHKLGGKRSRFVEMTGG